MALRIERLDRAEAPGYRRPRRSRRGDQPATGAPTG